MMIYFSFMTTCSKKLSPPVVTFVATLAVAAIGLLFYSHYISTHTIADPNIQDWNSFLSHFDEMKFCVDDNEDNTEEVTASSLYSALSTDTIVVYNASTEVDAIISYTNLSLVQKHPHLVFQVPARAFGIQGILNETAVLGIVSLSKDLLDSSGSYSSSSPNCSDGSKNCQRTTSDVAVSGHKTVSACLYLFTDTRMVFPQYKAIPIQCDKGEHANSVATLISEDQLKWMKKLARASSSCSNDVTTTSSPKSIASSEMVSEENGKKEEERFETKSTQADYFSIKLRHQFDIELAAYLSMGDKALINLHLIHTSYFLLVLMCLFTVFSFVRGRQSKEQHLQRVPGEAYSPSLSPVQSSMGVVFLSDSDENLHPVNTRKSGGNKFSLLHNEDD